MIFVRVLLTLFVVAAFLFCIFGIAATFEPLPASTQWTCRILYGSAGAVCLASLWRLWFKR